MTICIRPGIDGLALATELPRDFCCPPTICNIDPCALACGLLNILPSGPMWDEAKREGIATAMAGPCDDGSCPPTHCHTMVDHTVYTANKLWGLARMFLQPVVQESSPFTALQALDFWLETLEWNDCAACGGEQSLEEIMAVAPGELVLAVKRAIATALARMQLQPIATVQAINFIIRELGVELTPERSSDPWGVSKDGASARDNLLEGDRIDTACESDDGDLCIIRPRLSFTLRPHSDTIRRALPLDCSENDLCPEGRSVTPCTSCECEFIPAFFIPCTLAQAPCPEDLNLRVWPGAYAAYCLVRAMLPAQANVSLVIKTI